MICADRGLLSSQSPVLSCAFLVANTQLLIPLASLTMVTNRLCEPLLRNRLFLVLAIIYSQTSVIAVLVRPSRWFNFAKLYNFTQLFRFQFFAVGASACLLYITLLFVTRTSLAKMHRGRVHFA